MKKYLPLYLVVFLALSCSNNNESAGAKDNSIGFKAEEFTYLEDYLSFKNRADLVKMFGEESLQDDTSWYAEGTEMFLSTKLTNPQNGQLIKFIWGEGLDLLFIEASYTNYNEDFEPLKEQRIESKCGLFTGMSLKELRDWNEEEFEFYGFSWDYEGTVIADEDSKIMLCPVSFNLTIPYYEFEGIEDLLGDVLFKSDDSLVQDAPIFIDQLVLSAIEF